MANKTISIGRIINYCFLKRSDWAGTKGITAAFSASTAYVIGADGESKSGAVSNERGKIEIGIAITSNKYK